MRLLLVDDDPDILMLAGHVLRQSGRHEVVEASSGEEALALARASAPDAVITDFRMPGMDGLALLAAFKADAALASIPMAVCSGKRDGASRESVLAAGAVGFLQKPIDPATFADEVVKLLGTGNR